MAQQDIRYYLNGLLIEIAANKLNIVGTLKRVNHLSRFLKHAQISYCFSF
jgi:hypothetical protein